MKHIMLLLVVLTVVSGLVTLLAWRRLATRIASGDAAAVGGALDSVSPELWKRLATQRILFAHMSVGEDILAGVAQLGAEKPELGLKITAWDGTSPIDQPGIWHIKLGGNGDPLGKIKRFGELLEIRRHRPPDLAVMKLCYADVRAATDLDALRQAYVLAVPRWRALAPDTRFLHCSIPLQSTSLSATQRLKRGLLGLLGREPDVVDHNLRRETFNAWLRSEYPGPIFDIAAQEAWALSGRCESRRGGQRIAMMHRSYTTDGGHLNSVGRKHLAEAFLTALAGLLESRIDPAATSSVER